MKTHWILFLSIPILHIFTSCETQKEKVIEKEIVMNSPDSGKTTRKEVVSPEYIYKMYGCLNKDNLIPDGENNFILKVNGKYFSLVWKCKDKDCWLEDGGNAESRFMQKSPNPNPNPDQGQIPTLISSQRFSCIDLYYDESIYNNKSKRIFTFK